MEQSELECKKNEESPDWAAARGQCLGKDPSVRQPMEVDDEAKEAAVDATEVVDEKKKDARRRQN